VLIDADTGSIICKNARGFVEDDSDALNFPWKETVQNGAGSTAPARNMLILLALFIAYYFFF
jgi:hypothetical protein